MMRCRQVDKDELINTGNPRPSLPTSPFPPPIPVHRTTTCFSTTTKTTTTAATATHANLNAP
ncbi:hypothetical protein E2C01_048156 [Portunus trituberculatus]|uniref:Uncharacterized protein n=1 Tax=Portunus trituberculatus TaxID=210409 RepID=A0A5B7G9T2_PORTR|nr:hypothetical protein [Portunus trituberculatus]